MSLTRDQRDDLIRALFEPFDDCAHNMIPLFAEVERFIAAATAEARAAALNEAADDLQTRADGACGGCDSCDGNTSSALHDAARIVRNAANSQTLPPPKPE